MNLVASLFPAARPLLHALDPETAHGMTLQVLRLMPRSDPPPPDPRLACKVFGIDFPNPLGLAAGFDKNAEVPDAMLSLGFGYVEVGSVTPRPQQGNPKPRLFRLNEDSAVINRMGFNSEGHDKVLARLRARRNGAGIVAINLGANKDSPDRIADYVAGLRCFADVASYVTVNVSSPNTPGLRALQSPEELQRLLASLMAARRDLRPVPLVLKLAPDLIADELGEIAGLCVQMGVDGIAISNTTIARPPMRSAHKTEAGGLSGKPLFKLATLQLARLHVLTKGAIPLIGLGGVSDAETAWTKIEAGASLLQLYSALVFKGPGLIREILDGIVRIASDKGFAHFSNAVGSRAEAFIHHGLAGR